MHDDNRSLNAKLRYFLALPVAEAMRRELSQSSAALSSLAPAAKPSAPARYHVTLRYFGPLQPSDRDLLERCIGDWIAICPRIQIRAHGLDVFRAEQPRVLYARIEGELERLRDWLAELDADLERRLGARLLPRSAIWVPHITLARAHGRNGDPRLLDISTKIPCQTNLYPVQEMLLLASEPLRVRDDYLQMRRFGL